MTAPTFKPDDWSSLEDGTFDDVPAHEWSSSQAGKKPGRPQQKVVEMDFTQVEARVAAHLLSLGSGASTQESRNQVAMFKCDKCRGSGRFIRGFNNPRDYGPCNKCKGTGKLKTDPETRAKQKKAREDAKKAAVSAYIAEHVAEYTWAVSNLKFDFARSMCEAVNKHGSWTDGQLAAIHKCMVRDEEREKQRALVQAAAPVVRGSGFEKMLAAFAQAKASGLKYPKLHVHAFTFALAGERSKYAGQALFVKLTDSGTYLGRITLDGHWFPSAHAPGFQSNIFEICHDPLAAAVMHGKQTGRCSCCGRELENEESVRLGIGPICREKWGL